MAYIIIVASIVILPWLAVFLYFRFVNKNILKNYRSLSEKYGLSLDVSKKKGFIRHPFAEGTFGEFPVSIGCFIRGSGRRKYASTFMKIKCSNPHGLSFFIIKRTKLNNVLYGKEVFLTGDTDLDKNYIISTNDPEKMNSLLNFSVKYKLLHIMNLGFKGEIKLNENYLQSIEPELLTRNIDLLRIELMLHLLCEIADALDRKHKPVIQSTHSFNKQ
jgi:hypothetical protein